jgi:hypothetical protein
MVSSEVLGFVIENLFWIRQLSQNDEENYTLMEHELLQCIAEIVSQLNEDGWNPVSLMMTNWRHLQQSNILDKNYLRTLIAGANCGETLALYIAQQNAGMILTKQKTGLLCSTFEVSCTQAEVTTPGDLICEYPGPCVEIKNDAESLRIFTRTVADLCNHRIGEAAHKVNKANVSFLLQQ